MQEKRQEGGGFAHSLVLEVLICQWESRPSGQGVVVFVLEAPLGDRVLTERGGGGVV